MAQTSCCIGLWLFFLCRTSSVHPEEVPRAIVTLLPNSTELFYGQNATLRCDIQGGNVSDRWTYKWFSTGSRDDLLFSSSSSDYNFTLTTRFQRTNFRCMGTRQRDSQNSSISEVVPLTVSVTPTAFLSVSPVLPRVGDSLTLSCVVKGSSSTAWRFHWYRTVFYTKGLAFPDHRLFSVEPLVDGRHGVGGSYHLSSIGLNHTGAYICRGEGETAGVYTYYSLPQFVYVVGVPSSVSVVVRPNRTVRFNGEAMSMSCEGLGAKSATGWKVKRITKTGMSECGVKWGSAGGPACNISKARASTDSGLYWCESGYGKKSKIINITLSKEPSVVLSSSPTWWPNLGDSVNLTCEVNNFSTGWTFYWFKAVSTTMVQLDESQCGAGGSCALGAVTLNHTGVYCCRAGRIDAFTAYKTQCSLRQILWVVVPSPSASLNIDPSRSQHFELQAFTVSCMGIKEEAGNATNWKVRRLPTWKEEPSVCGAEWGAASWSACRVDGMGNDSDDGVYWCESGSGDRSAAINISSSWRGLLLDSPALPAHKGSSVTLRCLYEKTPLNASAEFYKDGTRFVGVNDTGEITIHNMSRSDEGMYWCKNPLLGESPKSWIAVVEVPPPQQGVNAYLAARFVLFLLIPLMTWYLVVKCLRATTASPQVGNHIYEEIQMTQSSAAGD